jgi:DNA polymerase type B, organellar and viral.
VARKKRPIWTLDCETDPFLTKEDAEKRGIPYPRDPKPFLWGIYEGKKEQYHEFREVAEVLAFLTGEYASGEKPIVYAHNGGKFADYHALRFAINTDEPIMVISGRLGKFRIGECEFRDSLNIIPVGLASFQKDEIDYSIMEADVRWEAGNYAKISAYMRNDCVYLFNVIAEYHNRFGRGLTQAGASMRYWAKKYDKKPPKQSAANFERLKPFYYGGRVECFKSGYKEVPFTVVDINSAYPRAMLEQHPFSAVPDLSSTLPKKADIPQSMIDLVGVSRGALPYREDSGKLIFPNDDEPRRYTVTGWEYLAALELGDLDVFDIEQVYTFPELVSFKDYIEDFYNQRLVAKANGDKTGDIFAKLFMNSLYGKFASDPLKYKEWVIASDDTYFEWAAKGFVPERPWHENYLFKRGLPVERQRYYNIATAASITGYVRAFLYRSLRACKGVIYCDTDSIAAEDVSGLHQGKELGLWKREIDCKAYAVAGKKLYAFLDRNSYAPADAEKKGLERGTGGYWKTACKGVDLSPDEIVAVAKGGTVEYAPRVPTYSILKDEPVFTSRAVRMTAEPIAA